MSAQVVKHSEQVAQLYWHKVTNVGGWVGGHSAFFILLLCYNVHWVHQVSDMLLSTWKVSLLEGGTEWNCISLVRCSDWSTSRIHTWSPILHAILYINDIAEAIQSDLGIFADYTKIFSIIIDTHDITKLQWDPSKMESLFCFMLFILRF